MFGYHEGDIGNSNNSCIGDDITGERKLNEKKENSSAWFGLDNPQHWQNIEDEENAILRMNTGEMRLKRQFRSTWEEGIDSSFHYQIKCDDQISGPHRPHLIQLRPPAALEDDVVAQRKATIMRRKLKDVPFRNRGLSLAEICDVMTFAVMDDLVGELADEMDVFFDSFANKIVKNI